MPNEPLTERETTRPSYTGRSLVFARSDLAGRPEEVLRHLVPDEAPFTSEVLKVPGNRWLARVDRKPEELRYFPPFHTESFDSPIVVERERFLYPVQVAAGAGAVMQPPGVTHGLHEIGIETTTLTGKRAIVAVLDSGFDVTHPDFTGRIPPGDIVTFVGARAEDDFTGHGTHCAGIIAGPLRPASGGLRYGIAPNVRLLIARVTELQDGSDHAADYNVVEGMLWAALKGAHVISLSLGHQLQTVCEKHSVIMEIIATILRDELGTIIVAATGNSNSPARPTPIDHPADCPSIVAVAALGLNGHVVSFSCGSLCDQRNPSLSAPGVNILSAIPVVANPSNPTKMADGTSSATPHVAGVAALWVEKTGERGQALIDRLTSRVRPPLDSAIAVGAGLVQVPQ